MIAIRTVVCPVDFSPATYRQLDLAIDVCRAFGARLVVHHNLTDVSVGAAVGWMWHSDHVPSPNTAVDDAIRAVVRRVPDGIPLEACVTRGAATEAVLSVAEAAEADLTVVTEHAGKSEDHASVIEFLLEHSRRPVIALHDPHEDRVVPSFSAAKEQRVLVATNLTSPSPAVDAACELARQFPFELHLLHVIESGVDSDRATRQVQHLVPDELAARATVHVAEGDPVSGIVEWADRLSPSLIVMGEHTSVPVKRWMRRDMSRAVLHQAHSPVWYVPPAPVPGLSFGRFALSDEKSILWGNV